MIKLIIVLITMGWLNYTHALASISCVDFVKMDNKDAEKIIYNLKQNIPHGFYKQQSRDQDKKVFLENKKVLSDINKCIQLRKASHDHETSTLRIDALDKLSRMTLNGEEQKMFNNKIKENIAYFNRRYGSVSLIKNTCSYPLIFLAAQDTDKGILIYEKRLIDHKIKTIHQYLLKDIRLVSIDEFECGDNREIKKNYAIFLNKDYGIEVDFTSFQRKNTYLKDDASIVGVGVTILDDASGDNIRYSQISSNYVNSEQYRVIGVLVAVDFIYGNHVDILDGAIVVPFDKNMSEVFFVHGGRKYRANKYNWDQKTNREGI